MSAPETRTGPWGTSTGWRHGLLLKLAGMVGLVLILGVLLVLVFSVSFIQKTLETNVRDEAVLTAEALDAGLANRGSLMLPERVKQEVDELVTATENLDLIAVFRERDGVLQSFVSTDDTLLQLPSAAEQAALKRGNRIIERLESEESGPYWRILVPLHIDNQVRGAIEVRMSLLIATDSVRELWRRGRWVAAACVLISILGLAFFLQRAVERPVQRLLGTMSSVQAGEFEALAPRGGGAEFDRLGDGLNAMLARIREGAGENLRLMSEVREFNQQLEGRVAEKTAQLEERNAQLSEANRALLDLELRLARLSRLAAVGQFAATLAHEIGTPLHSVSGHLELLREQHAIVPGHEHRIQVIQGQVDRVAGIVRDLLGSTRAPGARNVATLLPDVLGELKALLQPGLETRGILLDIQAEPGLPPVAADPHQLQQVFLNLFTNALDAMPGGGRITVRARREEGAPARILCEVEDTGSGIAREFLPHVFEPFITTKAPGEGSGLGLTVAHDIVVRHGGTIEAASEPGRGTCFTLRLPVFEELPHV